MVASEEPLAAEPLAPAPRGCAMAVSPAHCCCYWAGEARRPPSSSRQLNAARRCSVVEQQALIKHDNFTAAAAAALGALSNPLHAGYNTSCHAPISGLTHGMLLGYLCSSCELLSALGLGDAAPAPLAQTAQKKKLSRPKKDTAGSDSAQRLEEPEKVSVSLYNPVSRIYKQNLEGE